MKKFIISLVALFATTAGANAQIATENAKLLDNIYVGVEAGASTPLDFNSVFPVNAIAGVKIGKELTPVFGVEVEGQAFFNNNNFQDWTNTFVKGTHVGLNGTINLNNLLFGYKGAPSFLEFKTNTGIGWLHYWHGKGNAFTAKTALDINFNLGSKRAHTLFISPGVYWNLNQNGGMKFNKKYAQLAVMVGYVYHFKTSNGTHHFKTYDVGAMIGEIDRLNGEIVKAQEEVMAIKAKAAEEKPVQTADVNVARDRYVEMTRVVTFPQNGYELTKDAKEILDNVSGNVNIYGYASPEGSKEYNLELSQKRADAVAEYLKTKGVTVESAKGMGVVGIASNRIAIVHNINPEN